MILNNRRLAFISQQGFTIIETIVVIGILMSLMSIGSRYITINIENSVHTITAHQLKQVAQAAQNYVQDNYQLLTENPPPTLDFQELVDKGYLPFTIPKENQYGQHYTFILDYDKQDLKVLIITDGGQVINESSLRKIASLAGSSAGYISTRYPNEVTGFQESWRMGPLSVDPGHLASLTIINEKEVMNANNFLRRKKIDGHPEYNRMDTDLTVAEGKKIFFEKNGLQISVNDLTIPSDNGSYVKISGGGNKLFQISHPSGEDMQLWSNYLQLWYKNTDSKVILRNREGTSLDITKGDDSSHLNEKELYFHNQISNLETKLDNQQSLLTIKKSNNEIKIAPTGLSIDGNLLATNNYIKAPYHLVGNVDDEWQLQSVADKLNCNNNEGALFTVGDQSNSLKKRLLMCIWRPTANDHNYLVIGEGDPWEKNHFKAPIYQVSNVDDPWQLQSVADTLNCNRNEGALFMVTDNSSSLKKRLLMCIWRSNTSQHNYIVVGEGRPY